MNVQVYTIDLTTTPPPGGERLVVPFAFLYFNRLDTTVQLRMSAGAAPITISEPREFCARDGVSQFNEIFVSWTPSAGVVEILASNEVGVFLTGKGSGAAAQDYEMVVPAGAASVAPGEPRDVTARGNAAVAGNGDVWNVDPGGGGSVTYVADTALGFTGWRIDMPAGAAVGRQHIRRGTNRPLVNLSPLVAGTLAPVLVDEMYFLETVVELTALNANAVHKYAMILLSFSPSNLRVAGLLYAPVALGANWRLVIAEQTFSAGVTGIVLNLDTGIAAAAAGVSRRIRLEAGVEGGEPTLRVLIDGLARATQKGVIGAFTAAQMEAIGSSPSVGCWRDNSATADFVRMHIPYIRTGRML